MLITGILATAGGLRFAESLSQNRANYAARRVVEDLTWARHSARNSNRAVTINFSVANSRYTISPLLNASGATVSQTVELATGPAQATLVNANCGGDAVLVFNGFGLPDSGGTIVMRSGGVNRTIHIDSKTGEARM